MSTKHSYEGRIEIQSDGVSGSAGYELLDLIGSARLNSRRTKSWVSRRNTEHKTSKLGQTEVEITFDMTWDDANTEVGVVESAHWANTHIGVKFLDDESGTGYEADMLVEGFEFSQDEDGNQMVAVTLTPTYVDTDPAWS